MGLPGGKYGIPLESVGRFKIAGYFPLLSKIETSRFTPHHDRGILRDRSLPRISTPFPYVRPDSCAPRFDPRVVVWQVGLVFQCMLMVLVFTFTCVTLLKFGGADVARKAKEQRSQFRTLFH